MKFPIQYENMIDELINSGASQLYNKRVIRFNSVKDSANENSIELSDEEFRKLFDLRGCDIDTDWIIHRMARHSLSLLDALILYVTCL